MITEAKNTYNKVLKKYPPYKVYPSNFPIKNFEPDKTLRMAFLENAVIYRKLLLLHSKRFCLYMCRIY